MLYIHIYEWECVWWCAGGEGSGDASDVAFLGGPLLDCWPWLLHISPRLWYSETPIHNGNFPVFPRKNNSTKMLCMHSLVHFQECARYQVLCFFFISLSSSSSSLSLSLPFTAKGSQMSPVHWLYSDSDRTGGEREEEGEAGSWRQWRSLLRRADQRCLYSSHSCQYHQYVYLIVASTTSTYVLKPHIATFSG